MQNKNASVTNEPLVRKFSRSLRQVFDNETSGARPGGRCGPPIISDKYHKNKAFPPAKCIRRYM